MSVLSPFPDTKLCESVSDANPGSLHALRLGIPGQFQSTYVDFIRHLKKKKKASVGNNTFNDPGVSLTFFSFRAKNEHHHPHFSAQPRTFQRQKRHPKSAAHAIHRRDVLRASPSHLKASLTPASPLLPIRPSLRKERPFTFLRPRPLPAYTGRVSCPSLLLSMLLTVQGSPPPSVVRSLILAFGLASWIPAALEF